MRYLVFISLCLLILAGTATSACAVEFSASAKLVKPEQDDTYTIEMGFTKSVPFESKDHWVRISGAAPNQWFNISYALHVECNTAVVVGENLVDLVQADGMGVWERKIGGSGVVSTNVILMQGSYTGRAYATIHDQTEPLNSCTINDTATFQVQM